MRNFARQQFYKQDKLAVTVGDTSIRIMHADQPIALWGEGGSATSKLLITDDKRSIMGTNASAVTRAYTPFGSKPVATESTPLAFNGEYLDPVIAGYFLGRGRRVYHPGPMRFWSSDPTSPFGKGGINCYAYCGGDPINYVDPTGLAFSRGARIFRVLGFKGKQSVIAANRPSPSHRGIADPQESIPMRTLPRVGQPDTGLLFSRPALTYNSSTPWRGNTRQLGAGGVHVPARPESLTRRTPITGTVPAQSAPRWDISMIGKHDLRITIAGRKLEFPIYGAAAVLGVTIGSLVGLGLAIRDHVDHAKRND